MAPIVAALEAPARRRAIRVGPAPTPGNMTILAVFAERLQEVAP